MIKINILLNNMFFKNLRVRQAFLFPFILESLNLPGSAPLRRQAGSDGNLSPNKKFALGICLLSLVCLFSFINVVGYLSFIILINKYDIESKFPRLKIIIKYYKKTSLFFVVLEGLMCLIFLLLIVIFCLME